LVPTQNSVITKFDENFVATGDFAVDAPSFAELVLQINQNEPSAEFATRYTAQAYAFLQSAQLVRS
jgi:sulfite reductase (ferredoxin)